MLLIYLPYIFEFMVLIHVKLFSPPMDLRLAGRSSNTYCIDTKFIYISKFLLHLAPDPPHPPSTPQGYYRVAHLVSPGVGH